MADRRDPAFPLYCRDWLGDPDVLSLPRELRGCLIGLWAHSWLHGPIPERHIPAVARIVDASEAEVRTLLDTFFDSDPEGNWTSARLEKERSERKSVRDGRRAAGRKGAAERWQTDGKPMASAMANAWQTDGKPGGKRMASRWQTDGPHSTPLQDTHTGISQVSSLPGESCTDRTHSPRERSA